MTTTSIVPREVERTHAQGIALLKNAFVAAPIIAGADKFFNITTDWSKYLAPSVERRAPVSAKRIMQAVGIIEMLAGAYLYKNPEMGGKVVAAWLGLVSANLVLAGYYDIAIRDAVLAASALALSKLEVGTTGYVAVV